jgi:hypothetical protein
VVQGACEYLVNLARFQKSYLYVLVSSMTLILKKQASNIFESISFSKIRFTTAVELNLNII